MSRDVATAAALATEQYQLAALPERSDILIWTDPASRAELVQGCFIAAVAAGYRPHIVSVPTPRPGQRSDLTDAALAAAQACVLVIDASSKGLLHSDRQQALLASGTRILRVREPVDVLARLAPTRAIADAVDAAGELVDQAAAMTIANTGGAIQFDLAGRSATRQRGLADQPGRWDHWGTALVAAAPRETVGDGTLLIEPGDVWFIGATTGIKVSEPVALRLERGVLAAVEGGLDAARIAEVLDPARHGPDARRISHIGWGLHPQATWDALERHGSDGGGGADLRSFAGGVVIAFGANRDLGGTNDTHAHMDIALRRCTVDVDGSTVVDTGRLQ